MKHTSSSAAYIAIVAVAACFLAGSVSAIEITPINPDSCAELKEMIEENCNGAYSLKNDIDCTGESITPICAATGGIIIIPPLGPAAAEPAPAGAGPAIDLGGFTGELYGGGHVIRGVTIDVATEFDGPAEVTDVPVLPFEVGLFGYVDGYITELGIEGARVSGFAEVGALAGFLGPDGEITSCYAIADVSCHFACGGLVGVSQGEISNCYTGGSVSAMEFDLHDITATYTIERQAGSGWGEAYTKSFATEYSTEQFSFTGIEGALTLRISQANKEFADIDEIRLEACGGAIAPAYAKYTTGDSVLEDILSNDNNVVAAHDKTIEVSWDVPCSDAALYLTANEYSGEEGVPVLFPVYGYESYEAGTGASYSAYIKPATGHPPGTMYVDITDDADNVYIDMDVTPDNTNDPGADWAIAFINGRAFRIDASDDTWGGCSFGLTDKAPYKHKTCSFAIPKDEIGGGDFAFKIMYYGTLATYLSTDIGGFVGFIESYDEGTSTITNSYSTSDVVNPVQDSNAGGFVGGADGGLIEGCFAAGEVDCPDCAYGGGFMGTNGFEEDDTADLIDCYWSNGLDDCAGYGSEEGCYYEPNKASFFDVADTYPLYEDADWNFDGVWDTVFDDICYPPLQWQGLFDEDGDGYATGASLCNPADCDDSLSSVNPGAKERCSNNRDDDCDGRKDCRDRDCSHHNDCEEGGEVIGYTFTAGPSGQPPAPPAPPVGAPKIAVDSHATEGDALQAIITDAEGDPATGEVTVTKPDGTVIILPIVDGKVQIPLDQPGTWTITYVDSEGRTAMATIAVAGKAAEPMGNPQSEKIVAPEEPEAIILAPAAVTGEQGFNLAYFFVALAIAAGALVFWRSRG